MTWRRAKRYIILAVVLAFVTWSVLYLAWQAWGLIGAYF